MALQFSVAVRNGRGNAIETAVGTAARLAIRTGAPPASCAAADSGTEIIRYTLAADWAAAFASGAANPWLLNLPLTGAATGAGTNTAGHYRLYASDGTTCHAQGTVTATGGGGDLTVDNTSIANGQTVNVTAWALTEAGA
jgi:hypothetical protein